MIWGPLQSGITILEENGDRSTSRFEMRLPPELKQAGEQAASDRKMTLAALIRELLTKYLRRLGYIKDKG